MAKTDRVLQLLEALQDRGAAPGPQLAAHLGVDVRTLRRDVESLRRLGIPIEAERGPAGGYRLRPGYRMPPLMFTATEAIAVALGLLAARRDGLDADGALAKLHRVLPERVRLRVEALEHTLSISGPAPTSAPPRGETLLVLAEAAWRGRRIRAAYTDGTGRETERELSPYGLVAHAGRWYVPAYDHGRGEPRALRADRVREVRLGESGEPAPPGFDAVAFVHRTLARVPWTHAVEVVLDLPLPTASERFPASLAELEADGEQTVLRMRAESLDWAARVLAGAGCGFTIRHPDALRTAVRALAGRLTAA